jgi:hypothetical protein
MKKHLNHVKERKPVLESKNQPLAVPPFTKSAELHKKNALE